MNESEPLACPSCGGRQLRPSRRTSFWTRLQGFLIRRLPYRCRDCRARLWLTWREHRSLGRGWRNGLLRRLGIRLANYRGRDLRCPVCGAHGPRRERAYRLDHRLWSRVERLLVWECPYCRSVFMGQKVGRCESED